MTTKLGISESNAGDASGQYLNSQKMPVVGWQLGLPVYGTYPNYFGMQNANTKNIKTEFTNESGETNSGISFDGNFRTSAWCAEPVVIRHAKVVDDLACSIRSIQSFASHHQQI